jgi:two-component system OmpR family sensor kinase
MPVPIRARLTLVSAALMGALLVAVGTFVYLRFEADLLAAVDAGLRSRAEVVVSGAGIEPLSGGASLAESDEAFAQVLGSDGAVLDSSPGLPPVPLLGPREVGQLEGTTLFEADVRTAAEAIPARLLAVSSSGGRVVVVGASLEDQQDALDRLRGLFVLGGPVAVVLASGAGWLVAGVALRPVERMRRQAEAVSASEPGRRLPVPSTGDELARLGETLNRMLARLEKALERERRFVGDASHELRTPLANLKAELELALLRSRSPEELVRALRSASEETDRLARLAEDLLVLARAESGRLPVRREPVDVGDLIMGVVETFSTRASERRISLEPRLRDGLRANVDPSRLRQAVANLVDNALRHTGPGGRVAIEVAHRDGALTIQVEDTGHGFPPSFLPEAFEPFSRADTARARDEGGTGLGLAIVRAVAEAHGGRADAWNRPDGGAVVVLDLRA